MTTQVNTGRSPSLNGGHKIGHTHYPARTANVGKLLILKWLLRLDLNQQPSG